MLMGASYLFTVGVISRRTKLPQELQCVDIQRPIYHYSLLPWTPALVSWLPSTTDYSL